MNIWKKIVIFFCVMISCFGWCDTATKIERPLIIVVPSYNNSKWYEKNLDSIFNQNYKNYHVIYIDDCSDDNTYSLVKEYVKKRGMEHKISVIHNKKRNGALANQYKAIHMCKNYHIIVQIDGDDWLKHNDVFAHINEVYQNKNVWLTYGQFERCPAGKGALAKKITAGIVKKHAYREHDWCSSHLRTFYAGLFKQIRLQDLLHHGEFFSSACDMAAMFPMLEMAGGKIQFIDEVLYVYNCANSLSLHKIELQKQLHYQYLIRGKKKYDPMVNWAPYEEQKKEHRVGAYLFSSGNVQNIARVIYSLGDYVRDLDGICVFYNALESAELYQKLKNEFPHVCFELVDSSSFKTTLEKALLESPYNYVLVAQDSMIIKENINLKQCMQYMERTKAHAFDFTLGLDITSSNMLNRKLRRPSLVDLENGIYAWRYSEGEQEWRNPNKLEMTLYNKEHVIMSCMSLWYDSPHTLENAWQYENVDLENVGLCFALSKVAKVS